jgi:RNA polymerase sigma-70 factor, ECF subfamily
MAREKKSLLRKKTSNKVTKKTHLKSVSFKRKKSPIKVSTSNSLLSKCSSDNNTSEFCRRSSDLVRNKRLSDNDLISIVHNQGSNKELFSRYQKKLFIYIFHLVGNKDEAEDILQNVFSKMYKNIEAFDTSRKFSSWIYRIAHNEAINFLKRKGKRYSVSWEDITTSKDKLDTASNDEMPAEKWEHLEIVREIDKALEKLPKKYQQVLKLRYFQEYSYEDISKMLGKPINTIGTLINRAKKKLLEVIKKQRN